MPPTIYLQTPRDRTLSLCWHSPGDRQDDMKSINQGWGTCNQGSRETWRPQAIAHCTVPLGVRKRVCRPGAGRGMSGWVSRDHGRLAVDLGGSWSAGVVVLPTLLETHRSSWAGWTYPEERMLRDKMLGSIRDSSVSGVFRMRPVGRAVAGCHCPGRLVIKGC